MVKEILTIILLTISVICNAQTTSTEYFSDQYLRKAASQEKAKYSETVTQNPDGSLTRSVKNIKKEEVISSETYKNNEQVGTWIYLSGSGPKSLDYSFPLIYSGEKCNESGAGVKIKNHFVDDNSIGYRAPTISTGEKTAYQFVGKNIIYPSRALRDNIQGIVDLVFTITKDGVIENIYVQRGINTLLDKEAVRVVKKMKFSTPPTLNGQGQDVCVSMPISFKVM
jgi:TonB family protein